jgi:hypothetical protein
MCDPKIENMVIEIVCRSEDVKIETVTIEKSQTDEVEHRQ